jgi:2-dehydro-3-deoxyphosphogluconate aldolase/(4S)-4-hydroxy-2-oxoglutarate aldolase
MPNETQQQLEAAGLIAVIRTRSASETLAVVDIIVAGGITVIEVTMTVPGAVDVLREIKRKYGSKVLLGSGTVTDAMQCVDTIGAGAAFVVSPSLHLDVIRKTKEMGAVSIPGALTPTEVITAWNAGADYIKVFPCGSMGGPPYLKELLGPFPQLRLIPSGGVSVSTAAGFLEAGAAALAAGSDLVNIAAVTEGKPELITKVARAYLDIVAKTRAAGAA